MSCYSCDNILSVKCEHTKNYEIETGVWEEYKYFYYSEIETLNFDLNTGKQILLQDLFADSIDFEEFVNEKVYTILDKNDATSEGYDWTDIYDLKLVAPFSGIKYDQKYYIEEYSGNIVLIFDDETPEFLCTSIPSTVSIDVLDALAYQEKFRGENLFENETPEYMLLVHSYSEYNREGDDIYDEEYFGNEDIRIDEYLTYASIYSAESIYAYAEYNTYIGRYGDYPYVCLYRGNGIIEQNNWTSLWYDNHEEYHCFDPDGNELDLAGIFNCGEDEIKDIIVGCWMKNTERDAEEFFDIYGISLFYEFFDEAYNHINGFYLNSDAVSFSFDLNISELCERYFSENEDSWKLLWASSYANYGDIGCDMLNIF